MDVILTNIIFELARAAVATALSRELYSVTIPGLLLFSLAVYTVITRDPLRDSLPPYMGFSGTWDVLSGQRRKDKDRREVVRLSVFGRDVFWVSKEHVMKGLVVSGEVIPVYHGKGILVAVSAKEQMAIEKVSWKYEFELMKVFASSNLAMFKDVLDEELGFFISKVSKSQGIVRSVIQEFISRTLQRMVYGTIISQRKLTCQGWAQMRNSTCRILHLGAIFEKSFYIITFHFSTTCDIKRKKTSQSGMFLLMSFVLKVNCRNRILNIQQY